MSTMFDRLGAAIGGADHVQLDLLAREIWRCHGLGQLSDDQAQSLATVIYIQRRGSGPRLLGNVVRQRSNGCRPRRPEVMGRRRQWVASGWLPPRVAALLSQAHCAVMAVVAREVFERGVCKLSNPALAAIAGVSVSTVKQAKRVAVSLRLIKVHERRVARDRSLSTVIQVDDAQWASWLASRAKRGGGGKQLATFQQTSLLRGRRSVVGGSFVTAGTAKSSKALVSGGGLLALLGEAAV